MNKSIRPLAASGALIVFVTLSLGLAKAQYSSRSHDETDIFAVVLRAEVEANAWTKDDLICLSVDGRDPATKLVNMLRRHELNVCSQAEWRRSLACGFAVYLEPARFDSATNARLAVQSVDFREVNTGAVHFVSLLHAGEYTVKKSDSQWTIDGFTPEPPKTR
jgi:hypothetical protein